jgi:hypothetical protein
MYFQGGPPPLTDSGSQGMSSSTSHESQKSLKSKYDIQNFFLIDHNVVHVCQFFVRGNFSVIFKS